MTHRPRVYKAVLHPVWWCECRVHGRYLTDAGWRDALAHALTCHIADPYERGCAKNRQWGQVGWPEVTRQWGRFDWPEVTR